VPEWAGYDELCKAKSGKSTCIHVKVAQGPAINSLTNNWFQGIPELAGRETPKQNRILVKD
jgi:hypothetical protein